MSRRHWNASPPPSGSVPRAQARPARATAFRHGGNGGQSVAQAFFAAARDGEAATPSELLARDVEIHSDGAGRVIAFRSVVRGIERALRLFAGLHRKYT